MDKNKYTKILNELKDKYANKKIVLYGAGSAFESFCKDFNLNDYFNVEGLSDLKFENGGIKEYLGFKTIKPSELKTTNADILLFTLFRAESVMNKMAEKKYNHIKTFEQLFVGENSLTINKNVEATKTGDNRVIYKFKDSGIKLVSDDYYGIIEEVYLWKIYSLEEKFTLNNFTVFDIGMNRAYTAIYFANNPNCKEVYGFEPFVNTYKFALENISLNPSLKNKIKPHCFGLSDKNTKEDVFYLPNRDGISSASMDFLKNYAPESLKDIKKETVELKRASEVLNEIFSNIDATGDKILKIDAEGAEYQVIPDLYNSKILHKFNIITGDMHILNSKDETLALFDYFEKAGFKKYEKNICKKTIDYIYFKDISPKSHSKNL